MYESESDENHKGVEKVYYGITENGDVTLGGWKKFLSKEVACRWVLKDLNTW